MVRLFIENKLRQRDSVCTPTSTRSVITRAELAIAFGRVNHGWATAPAAATAIMGDWQIQPAYSMNTAFRKRNVGRWPGGPLTE